MAYDDMSPLSKVDDADLSYRAHGSLVAEIKLFRKALRYCRAQKGDDACWMDYRHLLMRFLPGYLPSRDDVIEEEIQKEFCDQFRNCFKNHRDWPCQGGDKGKTIPARSVGTLDCLKDFPDE